MGDMIPWSDVEAALHDLVVSGSQLDDNHVMWPGAPAPNEPYIAMHIIDGPRMLGSDWTKTTIVDDVITHHVQGPRMATLRLRCYNTPETGAGSGIALLARVVAAQRLPTVRAILNAGHVAIGASTTPRAVPAMREGLLFDPFAEVTLELHLAADVSEPGYVIERVQLTMTLNDVAQPSIWIDKPADPAVDGFSDGFSDGFGTGELGGDDDSWPAGFNNGFGG